MLLRADSLNVHYGGLWALRGVSIEVDEGEIVSLVGANGAGKSTMLLTISGVVLPESGELTFEEKRINNMPPEEIVRLGVAHIPEGRHLFPNLTIEENLRMGAYLVRDRGEMVKNMEEMFELFPILEERRKQKAGTLSGGEQQMLTIARGLMSHPKFLMLDEPTLGLAPLIIQEIGRTITRLNEAGVAILLAEQNARFAFALASRGYVLERGEVVLHDTIEALTQNAQVKSAYLGM